MAPTTDRAFDFLALNERQAKPRTRGITEMRGPYYAPMGPHYLTDILSTMGQWVDILKFSGGSFALMPRNAVRELIEIAHDHDAAVSTGGFLASTRAERTAVSAGRPTLSAEHAA